MHNIYYLSLGYVTILIKKYIKLNENYYVEGYTNLFHDNRSKITDNINISLLLN